jgi:hypothetical protein
MTASPEPGTVTANGMHAPEGDAGDEANQVRRGWRLGSELLRPAQVVVAKGREDGDSWR